jgi:hypothetical protein
MCLLLQQHNFKTSVDRIWKCCCSYACDYWRTRRSKRNDCDFPSMTATSCRSWIQASRKCGNLKVSWSLMSRPWYILTCTSVVLRRTDEWKVQWTVRPLNMFICEPSVQVYKQDIVYCSANTAFLKTWVWEPEKRKPNGRPKLSLEGTIKVDLKILRCTIAIWLRIGTIHGLLWKTRWILWFNGNETLINRVSSCELLNDAFSRGVSHVIYVVSVITGFILNECGCLFYVVSSDVPKVIHVWKVSDYVLRLLTNFIFM